MLPKYQETGGEAEPERQEESIIVGLNVYMYNCTPFHKLTAVRHSGIY